MPWFCWIYLGICLVTEHGVDFCVLSTHAECVVVPATLHSRRLPSAPWGAHTFMCMHHTTYRLPVPILVAASAACSLLSMLPYCIFACTYLKPLDCIWNTKNIKIFRTLNEIQIWSRLLKFEQICETEICIFGAIPNNKILSLSFLQMQFLNPFIGQTNTRMQLMMLSQKSNSLQSVELI